MTSLGRRAGLTALVAVPLALALASCTPSPTLTTGSPVGRWGDVDDGGAHVTLLADGTARGHDGCNGIGGKWSVAHHSSVVFTDMMMSLVACPGGDHWLSSMSSAVVVGDLLYVLDADGDEIGILPRAREVTR
jgi:heat shock protein HslJ